MFSLGLVLYELLSLRAVFDRQGLFGAQALKDMRAVDALVADVPRVRGEGSATNRAYHLFLLLLPTGPLQRPPCVHDAPHAPH